MQVMQTLTEAILLADLRDVFSDADVAQVLGFPNRARRHALVKRSLASGELVRIRRGLYTLAPRLRKRPPNLLTLGGLIYGPSYVSLESALAEHNLIPERVAVVTCGTFHRSKTFETPLGRFDFRHTPFRTMIGVERVEVGPREAYLLASPLRALADLAHDRPSVAVDLAYLVESMRIDPEALHVFTREDFLVLAAELGRGRAARFLDRLRRELRR